MNILRDVLPTIFGCLIIIGFIGIGIFLACPKTFVDSNLEARVTCLEFGHSWDNKMIFAWGVLENGNWIEKSSGWYVTCDVCGKERLIDRIGISDDDKQLIEKWSGLKFPVSE